MWNENSNLASNIVYSRKKLGLSQEALAEKANISLSTIQRIEKGTVKPRPFTLKVLADSLELEITDLISNSEVENVSSDMIKALKKINLYSLFFVFIPFVNLIIPFVAWKRNKHYPSNESIAGRIISFQLLWSICVIIGSFICIFLNNFILGEAGSGHYVAGTFYLVAVMFNIYMIVKTASQLNKAHKDVLTFMPNLF